MNPLHWLTPFWEVLQALATLTKDVERGNSEIKELREDLRELADSVRDLKHAVDHEKEKTRLILENHNDHLHYADERMIDKFAILATQLEAKIADVDHRVAIISAELTPRLRLTTSENEEEIPSPK